MGTLCWAGKDKTADELHRRFSDLTHLLNKPDLDKLGDAPKDLGRKFKQANKEIFEFIIGLGKLCTVIYPGQLQIVVHTRRQLRADSQ
jgi:hypothetical protein